VWRPEREIDALIPALIRIGLWTMVVGRHSVREGIGGAVDRGPRPAAGAALAGWLIERASRLALDPPLGAGPGDHPVEAWAAVVGQRSGPADPVGWHGRCAGRIENRPDWVSRPDGAVRPVRSAAVVPSTHRLSALRHRAGAVIVTAAPRRREGDEDIGSA